jgi:hypothetical protein
VTNCFNAHFRIALLFLLLLCRPSTLWADSTPTEIYEDGRHWILNEYTNEMGEHEVSIAIREDWAIFPDSYYTVLIGRSINGTKKIDIWFIPSAEGILKVVKTPKAHQQSLWTSARWVIQNEMNVADRWFAWVAINYLGRSMSIAVSHDYTFFEQIKREELNLLDLEYRLETLSKKKPNDPLLKAGYQIIYTGWQSIQSKIHTEKSQSIWMYAAGDVALAWLGAKLIQSVGRWLGAAGTQFIEKYSLTQSEMYKALQGFLERWHSKVNDKVDSLKLKLTSKKTPLIETKAGHWVYTHLPTPVQVSTMVTALETKSAIARTVGKVFSELLTTVKSGLSEAKYIALTQSLQIAGELAARPEDLFDPNPIVMTKKMSQDKDFVQNFLYMSNETFWMAAIASRFQSSLKKRFALCGLLAATDSTFMNLVVKGNVDSGRVAVDSGWEILVGNLQTQIDISSLRYFEGLALRKGNPKLKLLGYVVALVDQGLGYYGYAKASHYYEHQFLRSPQKPLTPPNSEELPTPSGPIQVASLKLIPVFSE